MPRLLTVLSSICPIPLAVEVGFFASGFQADSLPISLVKHTNCLVSSNSFATSFADTCIKGGLSLYITNSGTACSVVRLAWINTASKETIATLFHKTLFCLINISFGS
jgi:hypothetical protein